MSRSHACSKPLPLPLHQPPAKPLSLCLSIRPPQSLSFSLQSLSHTLSLSHTFSLLSIVNAEPSFALTTPHMTQNLRRRSRHWPSTAGEDFFPKLLEIRGFLQGFWCFTDLIKASTVLFSSEVLFLRLWRPRHGSWAQTRSEQGQGQEPVESRRSRSCQGQGLSFLAC